MKPYLCKECKFNNNGWCNMYECNGKRRVEVCDRYNDKGMQDKIRHEYTDYRQAVECDKDLCTTIAMEECAELIQAISKAKRGKLDRDNLAEEIADVLICTDWIQSIYGISDDDLSYWVEYKTDRIVKRLNKGTFK